MKTKALVLLAFVWLSLQWASIAQNPTKQLFDKYESAEGFTVVSINKDLFTLLADISKGDLDDDSGQMKDVINNLENVRILMYDARKGSDPDFLQKFTDELNGMKLKNFSELMTVREQDEMVKFLIKKDGNLINELLLLINKPGQ
ncbi:MAG: DUF4252 domain-containing protein, partial [Candidatus Moranbacteria bacterium]|nr:DUF4252 domain-containing protein [Candidatus Moranbacteria bacterium]